MRPLFALTRGRPAVQILCIREKNKKNFSCGQFLARSRSCTTEPTVATVGGSTPTTTTSIFKGE